MPRTIILTAYNDSLGIEKLQKYASLFGLNERTGIEIEEAAPQIANEFPVMAAIGQSNNNYTTVQLARYVTAVANEGTVYQYTLLNRLEDSDEMCYRHLSRRCAIRSTCLIRKSGMPSIPVCAWWWRIQKSLTVFRSRQPEKPVQHSRI